MAYMELAKNVDKQLYPDIAEAGGLPNALRSELSRLGSLLDVTFVPEFIPHGNVQLGSRSCQIFMAAHERLFNVGFWMQGLEYGKGTTQSLPELALAIVHWLQDHPTTAAMEERIRWFGSNEIGRAHEAGRIVDYQWQELMEQWQGNVLAYPARSPLPLIEAAQHRPELRKLVPFTSMFTLCFSRSTGTLFARDCPSVEALVEGGYRVYSERLERGQSRLDGPDDGFPVYEILGEVSTLDEALDLLVAHLPREEGEGQRA